MSKMMFGQRKLPTSNGAHYQNPTLGQRCHAIWALISPILCMGQIWGSFIQRCFHDDCVTYDGVETYLKCSYTLGSLSQ